MGEFILKDARIAAVPADVRVLLAEGVLELVRSGYSTQGGWLLLDYDEHVFWLEETGVPVAVLTFDKSTQWCLAWVSLVYVKESHRKRGCFRQLLAEAVRVARLNGLARVELGTHHTNHDMKAAAKKCGMEPTFERYSTPTGVSK